MYCSLESSIWQYLAKRRSWDDVLWLKNEVSKKSFSCCKNGHLLNFEISGVWASRELAFFAFGFDFHRCSIPKRGGLQLAGPLVKFEIFLDESSLRSDTDPSFRERGGER